MIPKQTKMNKTERAGTLSSVGRVLRRLRRAGLRRRVRSQSAVAVAAILDELVGAVMQDSVFTTIESKRSRLRSRYVSHAIALDATLKRFYNGVIPNGGVEPNIHSVLLPKSVRSKKTSTTPPTTTTTGEGPQSIKRKMKKTKVIVPDVSL